MRKAILLLHGFLSEMNDFDAILPDLNTRYDRVYRPILPGHGNTDECDYNKFTKDATFKVILDAFDELKAQYDVIDVLGFSLGGAIATYLSSVRSFNKLILISPANHYFNPKSLITSTTYVTKNFLALEKSILKKDEKEREAYNDLLSYYNGDKKASLGFTIRKFIKSYIWHSYNEFKDIVKNCNKDLKEIKNETLILWGKLDQLVPEKAVLELYSMCTNEKSKLVVYDNYTHLMLMGANPQKIIDEILDFIDGKEYEGK